MLIVKIVCEKTEDFGTAYVNIAILQQQKNDNRDLIINMKYSGTRKLRISWSFIQEIDYKEQEEQDE